MENLLTGPLTYRATISSLKLIIKVLGTRWSNKCTHYYSKMVDKLLGMNYEITYTKGAEYMVTHALSRMHEDTSKLIKFRWLLLFVSKR